MVLEMSGQAQARCTLVYALHSGNLYGTERMALYTATGLSDTFNPVILAPPGQAIEAAHRQEFQTMSFSSAYQFSSQLRLLLQRNNRLAFLATGVMHSALCLAWNKIYRRRITHLHLVHGGAGERLSYGRKRLLNGRPITFIAVSGYVRERLIANGVRNAQIRVIENFLPDCQVASARRRPVFEGQPLRRIIVISRLDPEKQVGLLLDALEQAVDFDQLEVRVFGTGWELEPLRKRAAEAQLKVCFEGFSQDIFEALSESDLLVHLCPVEPFGIAMLEAFAAGVPTLVADTGGAASLAQEGRSGFHFQAGNVTDLIRRLREVVALSSAALNSVVAEARLLLQMRFSAPERIADYRRLLEQSAV